MLPLQEAVQVLIKHSADVNARDKNWQTPLHVAAANKAVKCAEVIIPMLSSVNVSDRGGRTALHHAALNGHIEVSWLIAKLIFDYLFIFSSFKCLSTMAGSGLSLISLTPVIAVIQLLPNCVPSYLSTEVRVAGKHVCRAGMQVNCACKLEELAVPPALAIQVCPGLFCA